MSMDLGNNPNQRTPCVLVLDLSYSMRTSGDAGIIPINELNQGLQSLEDALKSDPSAKTRVQLAIVAVGGPKGGASVLMDWTDVMEFEAFQLKADGNTPLGEGLHLALDLIEHGKQQLKSAGISYTRPWMMVISDGEPTSSEDVWNEAVSRCLAAQDQKKVELFSIGVAGANLQKLGEISRKPIYTLKAVKFKELFVWISSSLSAASRSRPGEKIQLDSTDPWRNVGI